MVFMEAINALGLRPDDPKLLLAAANAWTVVALDVPRANRGRARATRAGPGTLLLDVDLEIAEAVTTAVDAPETDVRTMARELAREPRALR